MNIKKFIFFGLLLNVFLSNSTDFENHIEKKPYVLHLPENAVIRDHEGKLFISTCLFPIHTYKKSGKEIKEILTKDTANKDIKPVDISLSVFFNNGSNDFEDILENGIKELRINENLILSCTIHKLKNKKSNKDIIISAMSKYRTKAAEDKMKKEKLAREAEEKRKKDELERQKRSRLEQHETLAKSFTISKL